MLFSRVGNAVSRIASEFPNTSSPVLDAGNQSTTLTILSEIGKIVLRVSLLAESRNSSATVNASIRSISLQSTRTKVLLWLSDFNWPKLCTPKAILSVRREESEFLRITSSLVTEIESILAEFLPVFRDKAKQRAALVEARMQWEKAESVARFRKLTKAALLTGDFIDLVSAFEAIDPKENAIERASLIPISHSRHLGLHFHQGHFIVYDTRYVARAAYVSNVYQVPITSLRSVEMLDRQADVGLSDERIFYKHLRVQLDCPIVPASQRAPAIRQPMANEPEVPTDCIYIICSHWNQGELMAIIEELILGTSGAKAAIANGKGPVTGEVVVTL